MRETINDAYKTALKARDARRTATLRAVNAAIKDRDIANRSAGKDAVAGADILALLQKMVKQREESLGIYQKAGRDDLAIVEAEEIAILNEFLPKALSEDEIAKAIAAAITRTGAAGAKDMGRVIAVLKADHPGRIDFSKVGAAVKAALG